MKSGFRGPFFLDSSEQRKECCNLYVSRVYSRGYNPPITTRTGREKRADHMSAMWKRKLSVLAGNLPLIQSSSTTLTLILKIRYNSSFQNGANKVLCYAKIISPYNLP